MRKLITNTVCEHLRVDPDDVTDPTARRSSATCMARQVRIYLFRHIANMSVQDVMDETGCLECVVHEAERDIRRARDSAVFNAMMEAIIEKLEGSNANADTAAASV